jgi:hypothetical protein
VTPDIATSMLLAFASVCAAAATTSVAQTTDPLPSWNDGKATQAIVDFVAKVTKEGSPDFVPAAERIATFDNDGTLWAEQPMYFQLLFAIDRIKELAPQHPEWKEKEPFKSVLAGDVKAAFAGGVKSLIEIVAAGTTDMTPDEFYQLVNTWAATAKHPTTGRLYTEMVYHPMLEVLAYLRANGFRTFITSGGGVEFMRAFAGTSAGGRLPRSATLTAICRCCSGRVPVRARGSACLFATPTRSVSGRTTFHHRAGWKKVWRKPAPRAGRWWI